ncbi:MAG: hypothetical protein ACRD3D_13235 [Terriglobia bacterium]
MPKLPPDSKALLQTALSSSLISHHFGKCPRFRQLFLDHLRQCPAHREEMEQLRSQARDWAESLRKKLLGF